MAKIIRFALKMPDGFEARNIEDLREHFDLRALLSYYSDGRLTRWLENGYYDEEAKKVSELSPDSDELGKQLCEILGVAYTEDMAVNVTAVLEENDKRERLKRFTSDTKILDNADRVAFIQEELDELIKDGVKEVYLCGEHFILPTTVPDVTYIGVNKPSADFEGDTFEKGIHINDIKLDIDKYLDNNYDLLNSDNQSFGNFVAFFNSDLKSDIESAEIASKKSQCLIGMCYSVVKDNIKELEWLQKSASQNFADAQFYMGKHYFDIVHNDVDDDMDDIDVETWEQTGREAVKWFHKAVKQEHTRAYIYLGKCHIYYIGGMANTLEAETMFRIAAGRGDAEAQCELGNYYAGVYDCNIGEPNYQKAAKWYRMSAKKGYAEAIYRLGNCYFSGKGIEEDKQEAEKWFRQAAEKGYTQAQQFLDEHY